jgi:L-ribulose-5-phosphate 3-epimerase
MSTGEPNPPSPRVSRRTALQSALAAAGGTALVAARGGAAPRDKPDERRASPRRYDMKKSINLWAFPYPQRMTLKECLQLAKDAGFDGIELNYDLDNDLSPRSGTKEYQALRKTAEDIGIAISGLCSFLYWPYSLTGNDAARRARGLELANLMMQAAHDLGTENLLVVPGAVHIPWLPDHDPVPADVCDRRAREAIAKLVPRAEKLGVSINIENIFFNGYLLSPADLNAFVDGFNSKHVRVHFDTGNIMLFQFPEDWVRLLGKRIRNVHLKEFSKKGTDHSLESFRTLLDGTTNWPAVLQALDQVGYRGYLTFEYFHPFPHYPEALIYHTSDALDRILGRKV